MLGATEGEYLIICTFIIVHSNSVNPTEWIKSNTILYRITGALAYECRQRRKDRIRGERRDIKGKESGRRDHGSLNDPKFIERQ